MDLAIQGLQWLLEHDALHKELKSLYQRLEMHFGKLKSLVTLLVVREREYADVNHWIELPCPLQVVSCSTLKGVE